MTNNLRGAADHHHLRSRRDGALRQAARGPPLHPRPGRVHRGRQPQEPDLDVDRAEPLRSRDDREHRRIGRPRDAGRPRRHHRAATWRRPASTGCRRSRATSRWCCRPTRSCTRPRRSRRSSRRTATSRPTRRSPSWSTTRRCPVVVDPFKSLEPDAPILRPDRGPDKATNRIWHWESGDRAAADAALAASDRVVPIDVYIPRIHVASMETCGCIADWDPVRAHLDFHVTSQAAHVYRTVISLVSGIPESSIRVKTHDIGGGFGGQGAGLSRLRDLDRRVADPGPAGQVDRGPLGEPAGRFVRPRLPHPRGARRQQRREDPGPAGQDARRPRLHATRRPIRPSTRPASST